MKSKLMILLAATAMLSSGCAHMPGWMLEAHVGAYNRLHPDTPIEAGDESKK